MIHNTLVIGDTHVPFEHRDYLSFCKRIQKSFECNFKTYVNRLRINESKRLLAETELNMGEIAFKVGFSNQTHFNRVFKNFENISPSDYRENAHL